MAPTSRVATPDLAESSRRRLSSSSDNSITSAESDFSFISAAPSIQSLDTNGSIMGGIILGLESVTIENIENVPDATTDAEPHQARTAPTPTFSADEIAQKSTAGADETPPQASPFWYQHPGFDPNPRAPFKHELGRLCKHIGAKTKKEKKDLQTKALTAEIKYHYGAAMNRLDRWQELCEEVGIEKIPTSITQCQKVIAAHS